MQLLPGVHQFKVPIPKNSIIVDGNLEYTLTYAVQGRDGWVLVDAGLESDIGWTSLQEQLAETGIGFKDVKSLVVTHIHPDHLGLAPRIKQISPHTELIMHELDSPRGAQWRAAVNNDPSPIQAWLLRHGVPVESIESTGWGRGPRRGFFVDIEVDRKLTERQVRIPGTDGIYALWTPGHTPGHLCIYDADRKVLFSGDHILPKITPNVSYGFGAHGNPLKDFLESLRWVGTFDVQMVCPPHQHVFHDLKGRLEELYRHHDERLGGIMTALEDGPRSPFDIASRLKWSIRRPWAEMQPTTRIMAMFETNSHLRLLAEEKKIKELPGELLLYQAGAPTPA